MAGPLLFEKFPTELIIHIIELLPKEALANLRVASKFFEGLATPVLYRQCILRYSIASAEKAWHIMNKPALANHVRDFRFEVTLPRWVRQVYYR